MYPLAHLTLQPTRQIGLLQNAQGIFWWTLSKYTMSPKTARLAMGRTDWSEKGWDSDMKETMNYLFNQTSEIRFLSFEAHSSIKHVGTYRTFFHHPTSNVLNWTGTPIPQFFQSPRAHFTAWNTPWFHSTQASTTCAPCTS